MGRGLGCIGVSCGTVIVLIVLLRYVVCVKREIKRDTRRKRQRGMRDMDIREHTHTNTRTRARRHTHTHARAHTRTHTHKHTHTHTRANTHTYTQTHEYSIHISYPHRLRQIPYAIFFLQQKTKKPKTPKLQTLNRTRTRK